VRRKWEEYKDMTDVLKHLDKVETMMLTFLDGATQKEFSRRVDFILSSGQTFNLSVEECLFQSFTEQLYYMGELIALLWQDNTEPPRIQWFWNNPREAQHDTEAARNPAC
jgi:hypothetical protein